MGLLIRSASWLNDGQATFATFALAIKICLKHFQMQPLKCPIPMARNWRRSEYVFYDSIWCT